VLRSNDTVISEKGDEPATWIVLALGIERPATMKDSASTSLAGARPARFAVARQHIVYWRDGPWTFISQLTGITTL
jgi:hypothetical protein